MKNKQSTTNLYLAWTLALVLPAFSCKKLIEIPANAPGNIVTSQVFTDSGSAVAAVTGIYSGFMGSFGSFDFPSGAITLYTGLSGDELGYTGTGQSSQAFFQNQLLPTTQNISDLWQGAYGSSRLYQINACIEGLSANKTLSASLKNQLTGEVKTARAFFYFNLVNLFGPVPLVVSTDYQINNTLPRSDTGLVYQQIVADLTDAEKQLSAPYPSAGRERPNLYTALALHARVNLYRQRWAEAEAAASKVIDAGVYHLETDVANVFFAGSAEAIWQLPPGGGVFNPNMVTTEGYLFVPDMIYTQVPPYVISDHLYAAFGTGDERLTNWINTSTDGVHTYHYPAKYKRSYSNYSSPAEDYMVLRLGEQYLVRAEARAEQNNIAGALDDVNTIRERAGLADTAAATQADMLGILMRERQLELSCEWGHRWYDLKRTGTISTVLGTEKPGWKPSAAYYPIPLNQIKLNPRLTQNEGYTQ